MARTGHSQTATHHCENNAAYSALAEQGLRLSKDGQLDAALKIYRAAYVECQDPRLLYNMGRLLHRLGMYAEASDYYERFMASKDETDPERLMQVREYYLEARQAAKRPSQAPQVKQTVPLKQPVSEQPSRVSSRRPPIPAIALMVGGGVLLAAGVGLGVSTLNASHELTQGDGPFDAPLYERAKLTNNLGIAFNAAGGVSLTSGLIWTMVWAVQRGKTEGPKLAAVSSMLVPPSGTR